MREECLINKTAQVLLCPSQTAFLKFMFILCIVPSARLSKPNKAFTTDMIYKIVLSEVRCVHMCLHNPIVLFVSLSLNMKITLQYAQVLNLIIGQFVNGSQMAIKKMKPKQTMVRNTLLQYFKM